MLLDNRHPQAGPHAQVVCCLRLQRSPGHPTIECQAPSLPCVCFLHTGLHPWASPAKEPHRRDESAGTLSIATEPATVRDFRECRGVMG